MFTETASKRRMSIKREADRIIIAFSETPSNRVAENAINQYATPGSALAFAVDIIDRRLGEGAVKDLLKKTFNPTIVGADTGKLEYRDILDEENRRLVEEAQRVRVIRSLVDLFFKEGEREQEAKPPSIDKMVKKSITNIMDKFSGKPQQNEEK